MYEKHTSGRLLRLPGVRQLFPVSRAQLYRLVREQNFPAPFHINGGRMSFWSEDAVMAWLADNAPRGASSVR